MNSGQTIFHSSFFIFHSLTMEFIYNILPENILYALGWTVLHSFWQAFLIALLLAAYLLLGQQRDAKKRYWASCTAMGATLLFSVVTFFVLLENNEAIAVLPAIVAGAEGQTIGQYFIENQQATFAAYFDKNMPLIVSVWLMGMLFFLLKTLGGLLYVQRLKTRNLSPVPEQWHSILNQFKTALGIQQNVKLTASTLVKTPMIVGWLKPVILMPVAAINQLSLQQVEAILAHELAHIARYDYLINLLQTIVEALFYFNPAVWWISACIRTERENCCDDIAVATCGNSIAYAKALVALQEMHATPPLFALAFAKGKNQLLSRIQRILQSPAKKSTIMEKITVTTLLLALAMILSVQAKSTSPTPTDDTPSSSMQEAPTTVTTDTIPKGVTLNLDKSGTFFVVLKNGDELNMEFTTDDENGVEIQSIVKNGQSVSKEDFERYDLENLSPDEIASIEVRGKEKRSDENIWIEKTEDHRKPNNKIRIKTNGDGEDIDLEMKDGEIIHLKIDGELIDESDYGKYDGLVEGFLNDVPPPPPAPPAPPAPVFAPKIPRPPVPPTPVRPVKPVQPIQPAQPIQPNRTRTITTEKSGNGMTIIIEGQRGEEPIEIEIENRKKGNVVINGNEVKGLKNGDKAVIVEELAGTENPQPNFWATAPNSHFLFDGNSPAVIPFPEVPADIFEHAHEFAFPDIENGSNNLWEDIAKQEGLFDEEYLSKLKKEEKFLFDEFLLNQEPHQKELFDRLQEYQKNQLELFENKSELLHEHLEKIKKDDKRMLLYDEAQKNNFKSRLAFEHKTLEELKANKNDEELAELIERHQKLQKEADRFYTKDLTLGRFQNDKTLLNDIEQEAH